MTEQLIYQHKSDEKMDNPEYEKFLLDIADNVAELVAVSENRKRFEQHSCDLGKKQAAYLDEKRRADEKHAEQKRIALTKPKLSQQISYLKSKGWVEADLSPLNMGVYSESHLKPPSEEMPPEPLAGFLSVLTHDKDIPDVLPRPKIDEALAYYYFSLATIHDKMRDEGYIPIHNNSEAKQLAKSVWATIEKLCVDRQFIIKTALDHVEADLAKDPSETGRGQQLETPSEIELMEQFAEDLKSLASIERCPKSSGAFNQWKIQLGEIINVDTFWKVADWLRYRDAPLDDGKVWKEAEELWKLASTVTAEEADNYEIFGPVDKVRGRVSDLAGILLRRVEIAKQRLKPEKEAETKKDIGPAKRRGAWNRAKGLVRELYGLTIERITKAYLDKYG